MKDAIVAVIQKDAKFLFIRRAPGVEGANHWCPVSGKVEPEEEQADTVEREVFEEVSLKVKAVAKVWECKSSCGNYFLHWWTTKLIDEQVKINSPEVAEVRWLSLKEINQLDCTFPSDIYFFNHVI